MKQVTMKYNTDKNIRTCDICDNNLHKPSYKNYISTKRHIEYVRQNELNIPN